MSFGAITGQSDRLFGFQDFSVQCFDSIDEFIEYAELVKQSGNQELFSFLESERNDIDNVLQQNRNNIYGLKGTNKSPLSYEDALNRNEFVYKDEYEKAKERAKRLLDKALEKNSIAEAMKSQMIFTEKELGEFVYERASMSITPDLFYYSFIHKKELKDSDVIYSISDGKEIYKYKLDGSEVLLCIKVTYTKDGKSYDEYLEASKLEDKDYDKIVSDGGVISISSNVKKIYQFKEKKPRIKNAVKIFVGTTVGGFTASSEWGDFYTGAAAVLLAEYLESRDYSVEIVMILGGGRCDGCLNAGYHLNTPTRYGRRYIGITVKKFEEQLDKDKLLYWVADPSALRIKLLRYFNVFHWLYGDKMTRKSSYWHGLNANDIVCPIGSFYKQKDVKEGNKDLMYYFLYNVDGEAAVATAILNIVLECENINYKINQKALNKI